MTEVAGEGNLYPPFPPRGRDSKAWDSLPLPLLKALMASKGYLLLRAHWGEERLAHRPLPCPRLWGSNRAEPYSRHRLRRPTRAEPKSRCSHPGELVRGHLRPQPV